MCFLGLGIPFLATGLLKGNFPTSTPKKSVPERAQGNVGGAKRSACEGAMETRGTGQSLLGAPGVPLM